jgi:hypothetical protein
VDELRFGPAMTRPDSPRNPGPESARRFAILILSRRGTFTFL